MAQWETGLMTLTSDPQTPVRKGKEAFGCSSCRCEVTEAPGTLKPDAYE